MTEKDLINKDTLFIIDGSSFLYRAYYSMPPLKANNQLVNAVYGFCRMIKKLIDTYKPNYMVLVWDSYGQTERHKIYPQYKETRQAAPNEFFSQKEIVMEFADIINLKQLIRVSVEADDLMYSLAKKISENNKNILSVLVTSDKDLGQTLEKSNRIVILDPFKEKIITYSDLESEYGFSKNKLTFYYSLIGDSSDNIPGVKGIGPKTAKDIVQNFNSLDDLYNNLDKIKSERIKNLLINYKDNAYLSYKLFLLKEYNIDFDIKDCKFDINNWNNAYNFFNKYNFKSLLKTIKINDFDNEKKTSIENNFILKEKYNFKKIITKEDFYKIINNIEKYKAFAIDTETTGLEIDSKLVGISLCFNLATAYYIGFGHKDNTNIELDQNFVLNNLKKYLEDPNIKKYLHNAKFDMLILANHGINLKGIEFDTMIAAHLLSEIKDLQIQNIGLKKLSEYILNEPMLNYEDVVKINNYKDFSYVDLDLATEYAAADAHQTFQLYNLFKNELEKYNLQKIFYEIEMPIIEILASMEQNGILLDIKIIEDINKKVTIELEKIYNEIILLIDQKYSKINLNSPKQLEELLFEHLKLPIIKKTNQKKSYSTDYQTLKELSKLHIVPNLIIKYRELFKLKSTYLESLVNYINKKTNRIHTNFNQTAVLTGRLSSSEPNLQNIPVEGYQIRAAFVAQKDHLFISADYSQIELRILAYLTQDENLINAFLQNQDIHLITAQNIFDLTSDQVTSQQRQIAKRINFGIVYGLTAHGLSKELDISHSLANEYIEKFMTQYPKVYSWMDQTINKAKETGFVETYFNRKRYLPGLLEKNKTLFELAKRMGINTIVQGTAAEIVKLGMIKLNNIIKEKNLPIKILLQIHDELLLEVPKESAKDYIEIIKDALESIVNWNINLTVNIKLGQNWHDVTK